MTTSRETILELYNKERTYEEKIFGKYSDDPNLNVASMILLIRTYLDKAEKAYADKWKHEMPDWLNHVKEQGHPNLVAPSPAPIETYEQLIKVFALAGGTLESFADIDPKHWRESGIKDKWMINGGNDIGRE